MDSAQFSFTQYNSLRKKLSFLGRRVLCRVSVKKWCEFKAVVNHTIMVLLLRLVLVLNLNGRDRCAARF